jgi:adenylate cyclase
LEARAIRRPNRDLLANVNFPLPSVIGAAVVYFYFNYVDPLGPEGRQGTRDVVVFALVTGGIITAMIGIGFFRFSGLERWVLALRAGADPASVPLEIRRRALNAPLEMTAVTMVGWALAGVFYFPYQLSLGVGIARASNVLVGIVLIGGPIASTLSFLIAELYWRRRIPLFFPNGRLERVGVLRVPILVRLGATFFVTSVVPPFLMMMVAFEPITRLGHALPAEVRPLWLGLVRTQVYIVGATGVASLVMALIVARFINRPVQALRASMLQVAAGDLGVRVPVRSTDELGELSERFNAMVADLREAERVRELFGRYVSPAVARQALERGIALGGELTHATAMFVDLRGFTALTERQPPARVVEILNEYYAIVQRVCEDAGGVVTQFLGDGVVVVFGGPLKPLPDHARRAVVAAVALQRQLAERNAAGGEPLLAGIGICTGDMVSGNVGAGGRVTYTIVGDAVNQAARLQVKTRDLGASILLTDSTRRALGGPNGFVLRPCGALPLKGIAAPVETYAVEV